MHRHIGHHGSAGEISHEQAYSLCLLSVIIAVLGLGAMVFVLL